MDFQRPSPQQLLNSIKEQNKNKGKLKIFFGYAPGVGKTYTMLKAAHKAKNEGIDVVVGYIEKHVRPETLALLDGLEQLLPKEIDYKGVKLKEFDLDAALLRKPQLILVDELAHSNASKCRHAKRYQDVEELLRAGIDVYTTVNVQHLESLNDLIASITGITVSERFPDIIFDDADQVELVDIEPDDLIIRMQSGKVYKRAQASRALNNFFTKENLQALREIALRRTADRLNRVAKSRGNNSGARAGEHILICLSSSPSNARVIRTAARMSEVFHSGFTALFVETMQTKELKGDNLKRLRSNLKLAEQLGAQIATVYGENPALQIAEYAKVSGVTKIVMGRSNNRVFSILKSKSLVDQLIDLAGDIDIYIIPDCQPLYRKKPSLKYLEKPWFRWQDLLKTFILVILSTLIGFGFYTLEFRDANIIIVYILGVLITAVWTQGHIYGALASLLSVIIFNFYFTEPRLTLQVTDPDYPVTFIIMLIVSIITSTLATRVKKQARQSAQKAYYTELLMNSSQKLQQGKNEQEILQLAAKQLSKLLERPILYALTKDKALNFNVTPVDQESHKITEMTIEERAVADWVVQNNKRAGATTNTLSNAKNLYLAVRGIKGVMGVVAIPVKYYPDFELFEKNLMVAILNECGLILERKRLADEKQAIELETQHEKLRSNLLRAISHDFRTPLTSISGNIAVVMDNSIKLSEQQKQELYHSIYDDSMWLINLTENLLSITRIENGTIQLQKNAELLGDVFNEALKHIDRKASEHNIKVNLEDDLIVAKMDVRLIIQVIINILNNAIKYTPKGSNIVISAKKKNSMVYVSIADDGPGISDNDKLHLFDMFYTVSNGKTDSRRGLGLGLNLCRTIINAHGGEITIDDNKPQGSIFTFTLPLDKIIINNQ